MTAERARPGPIDIVAELERISVRLDPPREYQGDVISWQGIELHWWSERKRYVSIPQ